MRILIACEFSGIVRDSFITRGHDAISCDLLPTERPGPHIQGDVTPYLHERFDLVIAHPPCTYLSYAGTAHWHKPGRAEKRAEAMRFFMACWHANAEMVCVENPFGLPCQEFRAPSQTVNPFDFGEPIRKRTCLWLRGLPLLYRSDSLFGRGFNGEAVAAPKPIYVRERTDGSRVDKMYGHHETPRRWHHTEAMSPGADRAHERSRSFQSIANAMAEQWSPLLGDDSLTPDPRDADTLPGG